MSIKDTIKKIREGIERQKKDNNIENKIEEEINEFKSSNLSQDECLEKLEDKRKIAEEKQEKDKANMYDIAIAILKDLWAKKMSEAEQKKLQYIVEKNGIALQDFLQKSNIEKQTILSNVLRENLKNRQVVLDNAKKMLEENQNLLPFFGKSFGQIGKNIINDFIIAKTERGNLPKMSF